MGNTYSILHNRHYHSNKEQIMNKVELYGRITKDHKINTTTDGTKYAKFNLAVQRRFKNKEGEKDTDIISCIAWEKTAENLEKLTEKGNRVAVVGHLQSRFYEAEGESKYALEVIVDELFVIDYKKTEADF